MYQYFTTMKTVQQKLRLTGVMTCIALLALLFASCSKQTGVSATTPVSNLAVIDVSPTAPSLDFFMDGAQVNTSPIGYGGGLEYFMCNPGNRHVAFYQTGTSTVIKTDTVDLLPNAAYTLLLSNLPSTPDATLLRDSVYPPASGAITIRLVNASPDAGAINFGLNGKTVLGTNVAYRKATSFISVNLTSALDTVKIYRTGTTTVLQSLPVVMNLGGVYTVYVYGFANQTSAAEQLNTGIMENTYYSN
jgi:hypothetical protein